MRTLLRPLVSIFAVAARLTPRRLRFSLLLFVAHVSAFALRCFRRRKRSFHSLLEHSLAQAIGELDVRRIAFDPRFDTVGLELLTGDTHGKGVLVATTHANAGMSRMILRVLHDRHIAYEILSAAPSYPICGAAQGVRPIAPSGAFLLTIRRSLRANGIVLAMLDSAEQVTRASVPIESPEGSFWISEPILHIARRAGAGIVLMRGSLRNGTIVIELERGNASYGPAELARQLGTFALQRPTP